MTQAMVRTWAAGTAAAGVVALLGGVDEHLTAVHHVAAHLHGLGGALQVAEADVGEATRPAILLVVCCSTAGVWVNRCT